MRFLTSAGLALMLALPVQAGADRAARLEVARDYVAASMSEADVQGFIRQLWEPMVQQMAASGQALTPDQIAAIEALFAEELTEPLGDVMRRQDEILADLLTLEELVALRDFHASEAGGSVMRKMPHLAQRQQPMIAAALQEAMPRMMPKIAAITAGGAE